jgi:hypothetical protein
MTLKYLEREGDRVVCRVREFAVCRDLALNI